MTVGNLTEHLTCLGGPCCGIAFTPEEKWSVEALYDLDAPMENGVRAVGTYRVTWFKCGSGQRYNSRLLLLWVPNPPKEHAA